MTIQGQVENAESAETEVQKQKYDSEKKKAADSVQCLCDPWLCLVAKGWLFQVTWESGTGTSNSSEHYKHSHLAWCTKCCLANEDLWKHLHLYHCHENIRSIEPRWLAYSLIHKSWVCSPGSNTRNSQLTRLQDTTLTTVGSSHFCL